MPRKSQNRTKKVRNKPRRDWKAEWLAYMDSPAWAALKERKTFIEARLCKACGSEQDIQCHHMCYRNPITLTKLEDLMWLCKGCHDLFHQRSVPVSPDLSPQKMRELTLAVILGSVKTAKVMTRSSLVEEERIEQLIYRLRNQIKNMQIELKKAEDRYAELIMR